MGIINARTILFVVHSPIESTLQFSPNFTYFCGALFREPFEPIAFKSNFFSESATFIVRHLLVTPQFDLLNGFTECGEILVWIVAYHFGYSSLIFIRFFGDMTKSAIHNVAGTSTYKPLKGLDRAKRDKNLIKFVPKWGWIRLRSIQHTIHGTEYRYSLHDSYGTLFE